MTSSNGKLSALLALCEGNPPVTDGFPSQRVCNVGLYCFFYVSPNKFLNRYSIGRVIWDTMTIMCHHFNEINSLHVHIALVSSERWGVSLATGTFVPELFQIKNKEKIKAPHYRTFVRGINRRLEQMCLPFSSRYFEMHFLELCFNIVWNFIEYALKSTMPRAHIMICMSQK